MWGSYIPDTSAPLSTKYWVPGWTSARAAHDMMLVDTLINLGVDVSEIKKGNTVSFLHKVAYDKEHNKLVIAEPKVDDQRGSQGK